MGAVVGYGLMVLASIGGYFYLKKRNKQWKYRNYLLMAAATGGLCLAAAALDGMEGDGQTGILQLERNRTGQGDREVMLRLDAEDVLKEYGYSVTVEEEQVTEEEAERLFADAERELEQVILGENQFMDKISENLNVPGQLMDGAVEVSVSFDPYGLVNMDGTILWENMGKEEELVKVSARMSCQEREAVHEFYLRLVRKPLTGEAALLKDVEEQLEAGNRRKGQSALTLPEQADGVTLHWSLPRDAAHLKVLFLGLVCMTAWYVYGREKQDRERKAWQRQLLLDYPDIVSQLSLLSGAGMTIPAAWSKLALEYRDQREEGKIFLRPGYEEMLKTWREMQDGVGEMKAYENFGRRCDKPQYRKFASLLMQNIRKGTRGMQQLLDAEAEEAFQQRKALARQLGEEAGTKLLLPMGLMLLLVFAVLLVPAMLSMS